MNIHFRVLSSGFKVGPGGATDRTCVRVYHYMHINTYIYNYIIYIFIYTCTCTYSVCTSSTAQGGGGSFKNRKPIGEIGCCESGMAERIH